MFCLSRFTKLSMWSWVIRSTIFLLSFNNSITILAAFSPISPCSRQSQAHMARNQAYRAFIHANSYNLSITLKDFLKLDGFRGIGRHFLRFCVPQLNKVFHIMGYVPRLSKVFITQDWYQSYRCIPLRIGISLTGVHDSGLAPVSQVCTIQDWHQSHRCA